MRGRILCKVSIDGGQSFKMFNYYNDVHKYLLSLKYDVPFDMVVKMVKGKKKLEGVIVENIFT